MSLKVTFMGFAEGATFDARGQLALVGFMPQAVTAESFPTPINVHLVLLADDPEPISLEGAVGHVRITVTTEESEVVFLAEQDAVLGDGQRAGLGARLALVIGLPVTAAKPGTYTYELQITLGNGADAEKVTGTASLRVVSAADAKQRAQEHALRESQSE